MSQPRTEAEKIRRLLTLRRRVFDFYDEHDLDEPSPLTPKEERELRRLTRETEYADEVPLDDGEEAEAEDSEGTELQGLLGAVANVFCKTGKGGGIDPTCGKGGVTRLQSQAADRKARQILDRLKGGTLTAGQAAALVKQMGQMTVAQLRQLKTDYGVKASGNKMTLAAKLRERILAQPASPKPPTPAPTPPPVPARKLPHPELDPNRPGVMVNGLEFKAPTTKKELKELAADYDSLLSADKVKVAEHFGVPLFNGKHAPNSSVLRAEIQQRIERNLNGDIGEQLKNSPHEAARQQIAALDDERQRRPQRHKELVKEEGEALVARAKVMKEIGEVTERYINATSDLERKEMNRRVDKLQVKADELDATIKRLSAERATMATTVTQQGRDLVHQELSRTSNVRIDEDKFKGDSRASSSVNDKVAEARQFLDGKLTMRPGDKPLEPVRADVQPGRANYNPNNPADKRVVIDNYDNVSTVIHEYGHHIDEAVPGVKKASLAFLEHRLKGEPTQKLADLFPHHRYRDDERGAKDDFDKAFSESDAYYVGKDYKGAFTEVVSMGVQKLHEDPITFAKKDPEYFNFVMGVMSGQHRYNTLPEG